MNRDKRKPGQKYIIAKTPSLLGSKRIPKDELCDQDTEEDWRIAERTLTSRNNKTNMEHLGI